jgi:uncharacterized membrane protein
VKLNGVAQTMQMTTPYNRFAGLDRDRLAALSDGVFAVSMTLLVLDLRVPVGIAHTNRHMWDALSKLGPSLAAYLISFTMLGTFWLAQHTLMSLTTRTDRTLTWLQVGFLFVVTLLPFSASLLAGYVTVTVAVALYWLNILLLGLALAASSGYIARGKLVDDADIAKLRIFRRRIVVAQGAYGLAGLICLLDTYASVAALAAVQLYFIVSPHIPGLDRLLQPASRDQ